MVVEPQIYQLYDVFHWQPSHRDMAEAQREVAEISNVLMRLSRRLWPSKTLVKT